MKKTQKIFTLWMVLMISVAMIYNCEDTSDENADVDEIDSYTARAIEDIIEEYPTEELSQEEQSGLLLMREEEKLARDVYLTLYDVHGMRIFSNISRAESTHMYAVKVLLDRYGLVDPVGDQAIGEYSDSTLQTLYTALVNQGSQSLLDGLLVGATIEDLDIKDLMDLSEATDNEDILQVYENLNRGSRNHIRSYYSKVLQYGGTYEAQFISQALLDSIIATPRETGGW